MDEELEKKLAAAGKDVLVQLVKLAQKRGMNGENGDWKDFLKVYDKKFGASLSDPTRRTSEVLLAFLQTFKEAEDLRFFAKFMKRYSNQLLVRQLLKSQNDESPEQKLVLLTLEHPQYPVEYSLPSYEEGWIVTKLGKKSKLTTVGKLLAVDCEMVLCEDGTEALVKVCMVDQDLQVKVHEFVKPIKAVADYRTEITGVSADDLVGITHNLVDIQKSLKKRLQSGSILIGHSLSNDLKALKIDHARIIDTSYVFNFGNTSTKRRPSLNDLCKSVLGYELRKKGAPHNCVDDACAAMKLVLAKIERKVDGVLSVPLDEVPDEERAKLFLHRIPKDLPSEELHQLLPGEFTIEVQASKKGRGDRYYAFAIFENPQAALTAYETLQGDETKDSSERPQKPVSVPLKSGATETIYVRKMFADNPPVQVSKKRSSLDEVAAVVESKKLKTEQTLEAQENPCVDHVKEIERLNEMLGKRDQEISNLHKIIAALTRKQGL